MLERWVFLNGVFCLEQQAFIPINDRGFLFGEGMFTTIKVNQGRCELLKSHLQRLQKQAEILNFSYHPLSFDWIDELIQRNQAKEGAWRLKIVMTLQEKQSVRCLGNILATLEPYPSSPAAPCTLAIFPYPLESPLAHLKSLAYLDHLYVKNYAHQQGHADAITRTGEGFLLETGCSNLFWIEQNTCYVPDPHLPYLKGIFLQALLAHLAFPIQFVKATLDQLTADAAIYICNVLTHIRPVLQIESQPFLRNQKWEDLLQKATQQALALE